MSAAGPNSASPSVGARLSFESRGRLHVLKSEQWVPAPLEDSFAFFADASNLEALTPPHLNFEIVTRRPIEMMTGALIEYRLRLFGRPITWLTRIVNWQPGVSFTDVQLRGPYARWVHRHEFSASCDGTWVRDEVEYALPFAPWSEPAHVLFVRPQLREIFTHRQEVMVRLLERCT